MRSVTRIICLSAFTGALGQAACVFQDSIDIGRHESGAGSAGKGPIPPVGSHPGSGSSGVPGGAVGGQPGASGASVGGGSATAAAGGSPCGIEQGEAAWVVATNSSEPLYSGMGGTLLSGEYRLASLVEHGVCPCFDASGQFAQRLVLKDGIGFVISETSADAHLAATFEYSTRLNEIHMTRTCTASEEGSAGTAPFGPFETYTANDRSLWLVSGACSYQAEYLRLEPPVE